MAIVTRSEPGGTAAPRPYRIDGASVLLTVRLTPRGGRDAIEGVEVLGDGKAVLTARVRAAAHDGEANAALVALLARAFGVAKRKIAFHSGETGRVKTLRIAGTADDATGWLAPFIV